MRRGRRHPLRARDQRVDRLVLVARIEPEPGLALPVAPRAAQQFAVRPDPPDRQDRPRRQRHRERCGIGIGRGAPARFAAARRGRILAQVGRPDHRAGDPHRPEHLGDGAAIARRLHAQVAQPRPAPSLGRQQPVVDPAADQRADRAADIAAQRRADQCQCQRRHLSLPAPRADHARRPPRRLDHAAQGRIGMDEARLVSTAMWSWPCPAAISSRSPRPAISGAIGRRPARSIAAAILRPSPPRSG